jgi:hypothetical protein
MYWEYVGSIFILLKIPKRIPNTCSSVKIVLIIITIIQIRLKEDSYVMLLYFDVEGKHVA